MRTEAEIRTRITEITSDIPRLKRRADDGTKLVLEKEVEVLNWVLGAKNNGSISFPSRAEQSGVMY